MLHVEHCRFARHADPILLYWYLASIQILAENPSLPVTEVSKIAGARWKELPAEERVAYEDMWRADKERYGKLMIFIQ